MLYLPESTEPFRVVSLDPGSSNLGKAILENMLDGTNLQVRFAETTHLKDTDRAYSAIGELHGSRVVRLMILRDVVLDFLRTHRPHAVIVESNYLGRFATSFAALVECVAAIRSAVYEYDPFMPLHTVDPSTVKTNAGMKTVKGKTKDDVAVAIGSRTDLDWDVDIKSLDEHSVDAVAIGYYFFKQVF